MKINLCKKPVGQKMKLDMPRELLVGFAFLGIMIFWEVYDFAVPIMLQRTYGLSAEWRGLIMGLDNLFALFLLPLFGAISDKKKLGKYGRRTPFIFIGTLVAVSFIIIIAFIENAQLGSVLSLGANNPASLVEGGFLDAKYLNAPYVGSDVAAGFVSEYNAALAKAQEALAMGITKQKPSNFIAFVVVLLLVLVSMSTYRSPAVALMPDVTVKPLRSGANAVINFMGGVGGFVSILLYTLLAPKYGSFTGLFIACGVLMLVFLAVFLVTVNEPRLVERRVEEEKKWEIIDEEEQSVDSKLPKAKLKSLILILATIFLWFMGFNAIKSQLSVYATTQLGFTTAEFGLVNIINSIGGAAALIPVAFLAKKFGRKKTVIAGLIFAAIAFIPAFFVTAKTKWMLAVLFILAGFSLIIINVNTLPMVVELSKGSNVGRFTGMYYAFSMSAQAITPFIGGLVMENISQNSIFIYGAIMILLGTITMSFAKHGDSHITSKSVPPDINIDGGSEGQGKEEMLKETRVKISKQ